MSIIFETTGVFTSLQHIENIETAATSLSGPCDSLAHILGNALLGNEIHAETIEMTFTAPVIRFRERALIALTGAEFYAYTDEREIAPFKVHLMEKGDVLRFRQPKKGTRVYLAVAGGMQFINNESDNIVLKQGTRIEFKRNYNELHKKLFDNLSVRRQASWGLDAYSLARLYYSDVFHIIHESEAVLSLDSKLAITKDIYTVTQRFDRTGFILEGLPLQLRHKSSKQPDRCGALLLNKNHELAVSLKHKTHDSNFEHFAFIADYHLAKLSQKKPGSKLLFKWVDTEEFMRQKESYDNWIKTIMHQIQFQHNIELSK
ncbi:hypothetical protein [Macrococcus armenti]|uniref:Carboxyltransferase domain-containing protein n=1 Tax=Macrococcus armenti TaxID=2875764 RepID=A0ABY3ZYI4_9STAP|nr:hypothetical protein [Macrococcus armenti]UOB21014.1 hypothetical protein MRZ06_02730 [Macrococcus armenti]